MRSSPDVQAFVMAGGTGSRLEPLTTTQCKPALPFGCRHRVVDFVLSNLFNSGIPAVHLLVQYRPQALADHVARCWSDLADGRSLQLAPPLPGSGGYRGTADAVRQNLHRIDPRRVPHVAVFGADHVYRMDVGQMIDFHVASDADVTVATLPVPLAESGSFGIVDVDATHRIGRLLEKPAQVDSMPGRPGFALASMGNYVFRTAVLREALDAAAALGETDFGHHVLPRLLRDHRVMAYDFAANRVPGLEGGEERGYWRDIGTVDAYFGAHLDTLGERPRFAIGNPAWPIHPPPGREPGLVHRSETRHSAVGPGAAVLRASLDHAVLGRRVQVQRGARLERCILMDRVIVGEGARLKNVVVDQDTVIPPGEVIGHDPDRDRSRFPVSEGGIVVVPRGFFHAPAPVPRSFREPAFAH